MATTITGNFAGNPIISRNGFDTLNGGGGSDRITVTYRSGSISWVAARHRHFLRLIGEEDNT